MDEYETRWKITALKAIVQTITHEVFWSDGEGGGRAFFHRMLEDDDPAAMAIANELTKDEIDWAFRWVDESHRSVHDEMWVTPVRPYLTCEQAERMRVRSEAIDAADAAHAFAISKEALEGEQLGIEDRVRLGVRNFVDAMIVDALKYTDQTFVRDVEDDSGDTVEALLEPWRSRAGKMLEPLRTRIRETLERNQESGAGS